MAAADWIDALADLPQDASDQAFSEWLRGEERRPTPAGIRKRALARISAPVPERADDAAFAPVVVSEDELARRRAMQAELLREFPMLKKITKVEGD